MLTVDEFALIIGYKELELFELRKELARTRQVLAKVTEGDKDGDSEEKADTEGSGGAAD